jgi:hypothetical protein
VEPSPNRSFRRRPPFWTRRGNSVPAEVEEVLNQIESKAKASKYRELNLRALRGRHDLLVEAISRCTADDPCAEILCPGCARRYRLWLTSELLHLTAHGPQAFVATILLDVAQGLTLSKIEPRTLHDRVRKRLTRAGILAAIGGTEASYRAKQNRWIVHLHLLVFDSLERGPARLREAFRDTVLDRPVVCQRLRNRVAQISYLQKFQTCHRPGQSGFSGRGRAYPMKPEQIDQLAQWTKRCRFEDFLFVLGLRRRGPHFDPERGFNQASLRRSARRTYRGDGGDGGDGQKGDPRNSLTGARSRACSVTLTPSKSDRQYRDSDSKRAIREDKNRAGAPSPPRTRSLTVAPNARR